MVLLNSGFKQNNDMQGFRQVTQSQIQMYNVGNQQAHWFFSTNITLKIPNNAWPVNASGRNICAYFSYSFI